MHEIIREAAGKLDAYLKTGCEGFKAQAMDRLRAAGIHNLDRCSPEHLREHLRIFWGV